MVATTEITVGADGSWGSANFVAFLEHYRVYLFCYVAAVPAYVYMRGTEGDNLIKDANKERWSSGSLEVTELLRTTWVRRVRNPHNAY